MNTNNLAKPFSIQLTNDQYKALQMLKAKKFNKNILIRLALDEYLHKNFRSVLKELRQNELKDHNIPDFAL